MRVQPTPLSLRGRWVAITGATAVLQLSYWLVVTGAGTGDGGVGLLALGLALVPLVLLAAAFATRHPTAPGAALRAMGWFLLVGLPLGLVAPFLGLAVGFSLGGVVALAPPPELDTRRVRYLAVVGLTVYLAVLAFVSPGFAIVSGSVLPLAIHGIVDQTLEERAREGAAPQPR